MPVPLDLSKLSDLVKSDVVKKTVYNELVVKSIDTSAFILKNKYDPDKTELEKKIPNTKGLAKNKLAVLLKKKDYNTKITVRKGKIQSVSGLGTNVALTAVENKIPYVNNFIKKADYNAKTTEIE